MFGIGFPELLLILAIALMVIGPRRLPDIAKALGRAMGEFKRATDEFKNSINEETRAADIRKQILESTNSPGKQGPSREQAGSAGTPGAKSPPGSPFQTLGPRADAAPEEHSEDQPGDSPDKAKKADSQDV